MNWKKNHWMLKNFWKCWIIENSLHFYMDTVYDEGIWNEFMKLEMKISHFREIVLFFLMKFFHDKTLYFNVDRSSTWKWFRTTGWMALQASSNGMLCLGQDIWVSIFENRPWISSKFCSWFYVLSLKMKICLFELSLLKNSSAVYDVWRECEMDSDTHCVQWKYKLGVQIIVFLHSFKNVCRWWMVFLNC